MEWSGTRGEKQIMSKPIPDYLAKKNAHPRDEFITFDEGPHIYTVHGEQGYTSVTTFVHHNFASFDSTAILDKIMSSSKMKDPKYKYYGKNPKRRFDCPRPVVHERHR